jgi:Holliday junction DNA helicase RuvA
MIASLTGAVRQRDAATCVIDVNGVGYLVHASTRTLAALADHATLLTDMQVREDAITLFGFADPAERDWFRLLTTVQGVGGRVALNILSTLAPNELAAAIAAGDRGSLGRASGVGPKLAARLATELRDKVGGVASGAGLPMALPANQASPATDAASALANLGYRRPEAEAAVGRAVQRVGPEAGLDTLIREGLKELAR